MVVLLLMVASAAPLNRVFAVYRPAAEVIAAVCGRGEGDFRACRKTMLLLRIGNLARSALVLTQYLLSTADIVAVY